MRFDSYDAVIIGGGFYGCVVARELRKYLDRVLILEKEDGLLQRASYRNQARVHQGYHYPRSLLTSLRSRVNFARFVDEYPGAVVSDFQKYYAIARTHSKTTATQFRLFCDRIGAPLRPAPDEVKALFNPFHIEDVFSVQEYAFDAVKLRHLIESQLAEADVECQLAVFVQSLRRAGRLCRVVIERCGQVEEIETRYVFNCGYSLINGILSRSGLSLIPMKHELTELALVEVPEPLRDKGVTVMDGPFFSAMPFPARGLHSLSHVRYKPHQWWLDDRDKEYFDARRYFESVQLRSHYDHMIKDAVRYLPSLARSRHVDSIWEVKTILTRSEVDDSRPILFWQDEALPNLTCILGGKIDNIFDIQARISEYFETGECGS
jgi:glycine/D-amino acid oxidase-like deaminating enzyme